MTNTQASHFCLSFTSAELFWLLSAFGKLPAAFLGQPFAAQTAGELRQALTEGRKSLEARALIRAAVSGSSGYQVEAAVATLLHWLSDSERVIRLQRFQREGNPAPGLAVCLADELALLVVVEPANYSLTLFQNIAAMLPILTETLHLWESPGSICQANRTGAEIAMPEPQDLIPLAWKNPGAARAALERMRVPAELNSQDLNWVSGLSQLIVVSENDQAACYFTFAPHAAWAARADHSEQAALIFSPLTPRLFNQTLLDLFSSAVVTSEPI